MPKCMHAYMHTHTCIHVQTHAYTCMLIYMRTRTCCGARSRAVYVFTLRLCSGRIVQKAWVCLTRGMLCFIASSFVLSMTNATNISANKKSPNFLITPDLPSSDRKVREILFLSTHMPIALLCFVLVIVPCAVVLNDSFCNFALHAANSLFCNFDPSDIVSIS